MNARTIPILAEPASRQRKRATPKGRNAHHQCETVFKAFGRALRMAVTPDPRQAGVVPSTKGAL